MRFLAIDLSLIFTIKWESSQGGRLEDASVATVKAITGFREGYDSVIIACDAYVEDATTGWRSAPSFRLKIDPVRPDPDDPKGRLGYKANRKARPAPYFEQARRTMKRLHADGCHVVIAPQIEDGHYAEADDVVGWAVAKYTEAADAAIQDGDDPGNWAFRIVSSDKDLMQLVDDPYAVDVLSLHTGKVYSADGVTELFGVPPARVAHFKALAGDSSDNYKPFPGEMGDHRRKRGIGDETAKKLLAMFGGDAIAAMEACIKDPPPADVEPSVLALARRHGVAAAQKGLELAKLRTDLPGLDFAPILAGHGPTLPIAAEESSPRQADPVSTPVPAQSADPRKCYSRPCVCGFCGKDRVAETRAPASDVKIVEAKAEIIPRPRNERFELAPYGLEPIDGQEAFWLAERIAEARLFPKFISKDQILVVILAGRARGFGALTSLDNASVIRGQVAWKTQFLVGCVIASGCAEYLELESVDSVKAVSVTRRIRGGTGEIRRVSFTIEEARKLGYLAPPAPGKEPSAWLRQEQVMLAKSAQMRAARRYYPDIIAGLYTAYELQHDAPDEDE